MISRPMTCGPPHSRLGLGSENERTVHRRRGNEKDLSLDPSINKRYSTSLSTLFHFPTNISLNIIRERANFSYCNWTDDKLKIKRGGENNYSTGLTEKTPGVTRIYKHCI